MIVLKLAAVSKSFHVRRRHSGSTSREVLAVNGVSLEIAAGETLGLVGESGCGKSTLGRIVAHLLEPSAGTVEVQGMNHAADAPELRRSVQIVFQDPYSSLPPKMRVGQILAEPLRIHRIVDAADVDRRVRKLLVDVGLKPELVGAYPHQLSGGQRQRIGIARALAVEPALVVADEAVSALDVSVQAQILNLMKDLQAATGVAYLFISHDLGVIRYMSDRIAVMYLGRIVEKGPSDDLVDAPLHPYTAALLAAVPSLTPTERGASIGSEPPDPAAPPSGCEFHPRCPMAREVCRSDRPDLKEVEPGRWSACHFAHELSRTTPQTQGEIQ